MAFHRQRAQQAAASRQPDGPFSDFLGRLRGEVLRLVQDEGQLHPVDVPAQHSQLLHGPPRALQERRHLADLALYAEVGGEAAAHAAKLRLLDVVQAEIVGGFGDAEIHAGVARGPDAHVLAEDRAWLAHDVLRQDLHVVEVDGVGDRTAHADGVPVVEDLDARLVGTNEHVQQAVAQILGAVQQAPGEVVGGAGGKRAEVLGATEPVPAVFSPDGGADSRLVAKGAAGLAGDGGEDGAVVHHGLEETLLLFRACELQQKVDDGAVHVESEPGGRAPLGDPGQDHRVGQGVGADAAVFPWHHERQQPGVPQVLVVLERETGFPVNGLGPFGELLAAQGFGEFDPGLELLWNLKSHHERGGQDTGVTRGRPGCSGG